MKGYCLAFTIFLLSVGITDVHTWLDTCKSLGQILSMCEFSKAEVHGIYRFQKEFVIPHNE
jgi:hypothetical protein